MDRIAWQLLESTLSESDSRLSADLALAPKDTLVEAVNDILNGQYLAALQSKAAQNLLRSPLQRSPQGNKILDAAAYFDALAISVSHSQDGEACATQLVVAVAALHVFLQANLTGPINEKVPEGVLELATGEAASDDHPSQQHALGSDTTSPGDRWAVAQLSASGEDVVGRVRVPQYLLLASTLLVHPLDLQSSKEEGEPSTTSEAGGAANGHPAGREAARNGHSTRQHSAAAERPLPWLWWAARVLAVQQRVLSGPAASLQYGLEQLMPQVIDGLAARRLPVELHAAASRLRAAAHLEAAAQGHDVGRIADAQAHLESAGRLMGIDVEVTGALGVRTVHQRDAKAQLVVKTYEAPSDESAAESGDESDWLDAAAAGAAAGGESGASDAQHSAAQSARKMELEGISGDSEVLPVPRFINAEGDEESSASLESAAQALLLGHAQAVARGNAADELRAWRMAPFIDAVLRQPRSRPLLRASARLLRARHERERNRTRERALLSLQQVVEATEQRLPAPAHRMRHAFSVRFPMGPALRKELGEQLMAAGLVGAAMMLFEELELWDALILCYRLLQKNVQAEELVNRRLEVTPDDARLWCALGDLTLKEGHYHTAWERSGQRSTRAQRSLARSAQREKNYDRAAEHWELALKVNPLHPEGWFALGYCALKRQDYVRAVQAFSRCAQQEPDNGDAWNNLAAIHLQERRYKEAFSALSEAVKYKRESWQTWANYAHAAVQTQNYLQAARGVCQVIAFSQGQRREEDLLRALVDAVAAARTAAGTLGQELPGSRRDPDAQLERAVGDALKQASAAASGAGALVWDLFADYYHATGFPASAREAALKQVRALQGSGWQKGEEPFRAYAGAVTKYARWQLEGVRRGDLQLKELSSVRMLLRGTLKQAEERFEEHPLFAALAAAKQDIEDAEEHP
ncbi:Tetratricopeptide repeat protein 27 [Coccomyxa sp. Obi]|nr:Tetratricopeptide repeat protein 27 [Coccomyxa sp. Obi]